MGHAIQTATGFSSTALNVAGGVNGSADEDRGGGGGGAWYDDDDEPVMDEEEVDPDDIPETKPPPKRTAADSPVKIEPMPERISDWAEEMEPVSPSLSARSTSVYITSHCIS